MHEAEFDRFAAEYREQHAGSIRLSGETPDYFARHKIGIVARAVAKGGLACGSILDFGGGVGNTLGPMRAAFPHSAITLLDPSRESLSIAEQRFPGQARFEWFDGAAIPHAAASFDIAFAACVFHHIPKAEHVALLGEIRRVLRPGGAMFLFEHNPFNPLTRHAVRTCPFDENAVLIRASLMRRRMRQAGFTRAEVDYCVFFPRALAPLRVLDPFLAKLPLGAQYHVQASRGAA